MPIVTDGQLLANYIASLPNFNIRVRQFAGYGHMGAIITDAILQAGLNYRTVVEPRVKSVLSRYPTNRTTSAFLAVIQADSASYVLNWRHPEKPRRVESVTKFLVSVKIETEDDLRNWLLYPENSCSLLKIKGIGLKTVDYLKNLVGIPSIAVDRHIRNFVASAGIQHREYMEIRSIVELAADILKIPCSSLDHAIWSYMTLPA